MIRAIAGFVLLSISGVALATLPILEVDGFSWAENLVFDGLGSMFVSDANTGYITRIYLCGEKVGDDGE